jgi:phenylacetate-CoA oxygenase PaaJ subunit
MSWPGVSERRIATNDIELNIAEAGEGPLVLLLHGFPESWYSWRHQFKALAEAGYHVVAPDMRGYGKSDKPAAIEAYNQVEVVNDVIGLIPALGYKTAVVIGHDWGAPTAWAAALHHPNVVRAVGALSVPFLPRSPVPPMAMLRAIFAGQFFYQLYFFEPGVAEAEFEADIRTALLERGVPDVHVKLVLSPAWTTDWIGPEAREKLRAYGIAPPARAEPQGLITLTRARVAVQCPFCGSNDTRLQSEFGSTACKAIHVCNSCRQPFDEFKAL